MKVDGSWTSPVLIVEDDPMIGELLMLRMNTAGFSATWVRDGPEALERIAHVRPRVVVLDLGLPGMDGFQVLEAFRPQPMHRIMPIMLLTARHGQDDVKRALALGADDYVAKPFDAAALLSRIGKLIDRGRSRTGAKLAATADPRSAYASEA